MNENLKIGVSKMGDHYQPECPHCSCYLKTNENFDYVCPNENCDYELKVL